MGMTGGELRRAMREGRRVYGTCVTVCQPGWAEAIVSTGVDFVFVDTEHMPLGRQELSWMCRTFQALNTAPVVRVPKPDPFWACMALDAGAAGVIFPYVESAVEAQWLRGATQFRPLKGGRLRDALDSTTTLAAETAHYLAERNADTLMIVNIESQIAIDELDDILAVPDLDCLLIGPHDLSINLGVPERYESKTFLDAVSTIILKARERNVSAGIHWSDDLDQHISWTRHGANFVVHSSDIAMVRDTARERLGSIRAAFEDGHGGEIQGVPTI
jgi:2-keto-3-deoxy-L-rhamnonate aldolase RhmA